MFGIHFKKVPPTAYVLHYRNGNIVREGAGLSFWYFAPTSTVVEVNLASTDVPFVFHEVTADFQEVTVQGQLTYRVIDPRKLCTLLDFSVDVRGQPVSDAVETLQMRLINTTQIITRSITQRTRLPDLLGASDRLVSEVLQRLNKAEQVLMLGVEIVGLSILAVRPAPEIARALEAEVREALHRRSDEATYARRNAAVEQERLIKESELNTEIAVEEKRRQIRETRMGADIAVEEQRARLIDLQVENDRRNADSRAYALKATLEPLRDIDWRTLIAVHGDGQSSGLAISLAFQQLAENAQKIGQLNLTPDLLQSLLTTAEKQPCTKK
ncbi:MAG TPA: SPFH domain-containing protein [Candidatus Obscuribacterales bacterium]